MIDVVCSVPHSGTRTLVEHLGIGDNSPRGRWMHFGYEGDVVNIRGGKYHLHIPLRHPYAVASSWARRGKNITGLLSAYRAMFAALTQPHTIHQMELLPVLDGGDDRDRGVEGERLVSSYVDKVHNDVVQVHAQFFTQYYEDLS